jgi:hypothetical protein
MRRIKLTKRKWATVDDRFYDALIAMGGWYCSNQGYAVRSISRPAGEQTTLYMHRVVMELAGIQVPSGFEVDHKNCRTRDNRLRNLRLATRAQQCRNRKKHSNNTSGAKGVSWYREIKKWRADIKVNGQSFYLGSFSSKRAAVRAYRQAVREYFGEFARAA